MPTIKIRPEVYNQLKSIMEFEVKKMMATMDNKQIIDHVVRNKFGISFSDLIMKMAASYKKHNMVTR